MDPYRIILFAFLLGLAACSMENPEPQPGNGAASSGHAEVSENSTTGQGATPGATTDGNTPLPDEMGSNPAVRTMHREDLRAKMEPEAFGTLHGAELQMKLMTPIYSKIFDMDGNADLVLPRLTKGQRALYLFRKMDEAVTEGGLKALLASEFAPRLEQAAGHFEAFNDKKLQAFAKRAAAEYKRINAIAAPGQNPKPDPLLAFFDKDYAAYQNKAFERVERYIRSNPSEFITSE